MDEVSALFSAWNKANKPALLDASGRPIDTCTDTTHHDISQMMAKGMASVRGKPRQ